MRPKKEKDEKDKRKSDKEIPEDDYGERMRKKLGEPKGLVRSKR